MWLQVLSLETLFISNTRYNWRKYIEAGKTSDTVPKLATRTRAKAPPQLKVDVQ